MIQNIYPHKLEIEYKNDVSAEADSLLMVFNGRSLLCHMEEDGTLTFPTCGQLKGFADGSAPGTDLTYFFALDGKGVFYARNAKNVEIDGFEYNDVNLFRSAQPKEMAFAAVTGFHFSNWYVCNAYCGRCGAKMDHDGVERMMRCPDCGNMVFPKIMPSVIVGVVNGDSILLERYNRPGAKLGALVAGFTEIGETIEETVAREVKEECGLEVSDIRFYKSQPWGISGGGLLFGFWCRVKGDDTIHPDGFEIADAQWISRQWLKENYVDSGISLTSEMISAFRDGKEYSINA